MVGLRKHGCLAICLIGLAVVGGASVGAQGSQRKTERVLIETAKPYDRVAASVSAMGGRVTHQYRYVDAIAAEIPVDALEAVRAQIGSAPMYKDVDVSLPTGAPSRAHTATTGRAYAEGGGGNGGTAIPGTAVPGYAATHPGAYVLNFAGDRLDTVHSRGFTGAGTIVAVVDSGIRPGFTGLKDSVIGGEDFVGDGLGYSHKKNDPHGTFVAGLISNSATFKVSGTLKKAITAYAPGALDNGAIALLGAAPEAKIYALRVFGVDASVGTHVSVVLAAMQRVIDLRLAYNHGDPGGLKIDVCNLSVGVTTLSPGRSLLDRSADAMLAAGIVPVASSGDAGAATLTTASPGSSKSALTVGASSPAANDRIGSEVDNGPGLGIYYRPFSGTETAWFSSRGPNADGRPAPDVVATGVSNFSQGYCSNPSGVSICPNEVSLNSGTSFSAPIASGIAAVLRQAFPHASAVQIRNAIAMTGRAGQLQDGSGVLDRGTGLIDALGAFNVLASGDAPNHLPYFPPPSTDVRTNVVQNTNLRVYSRNVTRTISNLRPGERVDLLFDVDRDTAGLSVSVTGVRAQLPPAQQSQIYGDGLAVAVHSAKTSQIGPYGDYPVFDYPRSDASYDIPFPDTGLLRVSISGDYVNAGNVSATVTITESTAPLPDVSFRGRVRDQEFVTIPLTIPAGTHEAKFLLSWGDDWSHFPTADIDLILVSPTGDTNTQGVTLAGPERVTIMDPTSGYWTMYVDGFNIPAGADNYRLRVLLDGVVVH